MQTDTTDWAEVRGKLQEAVWADLASMSWAQVSVAKAAEDLLIDPVQARLACSGKEDLILAMLSELDRQAAASSHADFAEDPDANMHDKLLEGLLHRFETYQPYKAQMRHLHNASYRNPALGLKMLSSLTKSMDMLLSISGDTQTSAQRNIRVKGLTGLVMSVRSEWLNDDSSDLAKTTKLLDKRLKQAAELAESFYLI